MALQREDVPVKSLVLGPALITLFVTLVRLGGELLKLGPPGFPEMAAIPRWFWIGLLPQLTLWMAFTVIVGALFGGVAVLVTGRRAAPVAG